MKKFISLGSFLFAAAITLARAGGPTPIKVAPTGGPCVVSTISVSAAPAISTFTSTYVLQRFVEFQVQSTTDVFMGFDNNVTSKTGRGFFNVGDTLRMETSENVKAYFTGDGAGGVVIASYCK